MSIIFTAGRFKATDLSNAPIPGALLSFYATSTSTRQPVYSDSALAIPLSNPVQADGNGLFPAIYIDDSLPAYKVVLQYADGSIAPDGTIDPYNAGATPLTSAQVAGALNSLARTQAEINASVTPTDYSYPPGDIRRYGAVGDALINGSAGTDSTVAIQTALNITGQPAYAPVGNFLFSNLTIPGNQKFSGSSIHITNLVAKVGSTGTMFTDQGSAAKVDINNIAFYGNNCAYTAGFKLGYGAVVFGTEGVLDLVWVRDLPAGFPGIDIKHNVGEFGFLIAQSTGGLRITGTGGMLDRYENVGALGFTNAAAVLVSTDIGDIGVGQGHIEAPLTATVPLYMSANASVQKQVISLAAGTTYSHLIELAAGATTTQVGGLQLYFAQGAAWSALTAYVATNVVSSGGLLYYCILANTNQVPPNATYWRLSPTITNGNFKVGAGYPGGNATGGSHSGEGHYQSSLILLGPNLAVNQGYLQAFTVRIQNVSGTVKHSIGQVGAVGVAGTFAAQVPSAAVALTTTPTGADASTAFAAGGKIGATSTNLFIFDTSAQIAADSTVFATITFNNSGTAYNVAGSIASINVNGVTVPRPVLSLTNPTSGANVAWATALGTDTWKIDVAVLAFLR